MNIRKKAVCVDLDGTLLYYTNFKGMDGRLGNPRPGARDFLINIGKFARIIIFTARLSEDFINDGTLCQIESWLDIHDLRYDEIYTGKVKPIAEAFVDERAISIHKNPVKPDFDTALIKMKRFMEYIDE